MDVLYKQIRILSPDKKVPRKKVDLLISEGIIKKIADHIKAPKGTKVLEYPDAYCSIGWMDVGVHCGEPGFEHRETLDTIRAAAANGGFTSIIVSPDLNPVIDNKSQVSFIKSGNTESAVSILPMGSISTAAKGENISEMMDMHAAGAVAFTDGNSSIQSGGLIERALQYAKSFDGLIYNQPNDESVSGEGQMHEGEVSTMLGLPGIPNLAEELMLKRDLDICAYTDSKLHCANISTANSVSLIKAAKKSGLKVSASTPIMNLCYNDESLKDFDVNYKVFPPLRSKKDQKALLKGISDGTIDFISSNHQPLEEESKKVEFPYASFGTTGIETIFAHIVSLLSDKFTLVDAINNLAYKPRDIFGQEIPTLEEGASANLCIFSPSEEWVYEKSNVKSKSKNSPAIGKTLRGKVYSVYNQGTLVEN